MFKNIGSTIKTVSVILGALGALGSLIGGFSILDDHMPELAISLTTIIGGSLGSFVFALFGYGFGELVEKVSILTDETLSEYAKNAAKPADRISKAPKQREESSETGVCRQAKDRPAPAKESLSSINVPPPKASADSVEYLYRFSEGYYEVSTCKNNVTHLGVAPEYRDKPVKAIGQMAFSGKEELKNVILPEGIERIGARAFSGCKSLEEMPLPVGVSRIDSATFSHCTALKSITIPQSVQTMGDAVFNGCKRLTDIYCAAPEKPAGWSENWNAHCSATVHWGCTKE